MTNSLSQSLFVLHTLTREAALTLLNNQNFYAPTLLAAARRAATARFGTNIYIRGLIEFTNYCRNDCYYCGLRRSNKTVARYRLSQAQILDCCHAGYRYGFRTFVLQGGEDLSYSDNDFANLISSIKTAYPDCAVTLSVGEREAATYALWRRAGADRYLLRHETASKTHYQKLHPPELSLTHRKNCLFTLKELGYQVGSGIMVSSPGQTPADLAEDLLFLQELQPQMIGIGPFIPHHATPFAAQPAGALDQTLFLVALTRLLFPDALIPATTALGTITPKGRLLGIQAGANVVMPNLSPAEVRPNYLLYDNKLCSGSEAAESLALLRAELAEAGYQIAVDRGDYKETT